MFGVVFKRGFTVHVSQFAIIMQLNVLCKYFSKHQFSIQCLGESGQAVFTSMEEKSAADKTTSEFGFNMVNSDKIAMDRTIPDTRMDE